MSTTQRIPPPLARFLCLPRRHSLVLLTGVQDAGSTWLLLRYLSAGVGSPGASLARSNGRLDADGPNGEASPETSVLLVSWMRHLDFWRAEAKRAMGIDLARLQHQGRFGFVDGLTGVFASPSGQATPLPPQESPGSPTAAARLSSARQASSSNGLSARNPQASSQAQVSSQQGAPTLTQAIQTNEAPPMANSPAPLPDFSAATLEQTINKALEALAPRPTVLLLDAPSAMLFLDSGNPNLTSSSDHCGATARALLGLLMRLRSLDQVHALVMTLPADAPLLAASPLSAFNAAAGYSHASGGHNANDDERSSRPTSLDTESAAFTVGAAHQADLVLACRPLATGWAEDVSGVVRVSFGGNGPMESDLNYGSDVREWLYFVERDGSVRVWERGGGV